MVQEQMINPEEVFLKGEFIETIQLDYCRDFWDCLNSNIVRGRRVSLIKYGDKYYIVEWYSHTVSDFPEHSVWELSEIDFRKLDAESAKILDTIEARNDLEAERKFEEWVKREYFSEEEY